VSSTRSETGPAGRVGPGLPVGRVLGVPVLVSPSWLLFAGLVLVSFGPDLAERYGPGRGYTAAGAFAVLLLLSVLLHEIGHCVVARALGLPVRSITITFLAGLTEITEPPQTPAREYVVAVVGPLVSLLLAGVGWVGRDVFAGGSLPFLLASVVALSNGLVAAFNLLPGLPLDGGRVLRAAAWHVSGDEARATVFAAWSGRVVALVLVPLLLLVALPSIGVTQLTATSVIFAALIASFIYLGATASLRRAKYLARLPRASVRALARPAVAVPQDVPLSEAVRQAQAAGVGGVVLVDTTGTAVAVLNEEAVLATPEQRRPWVAASTVGRRLTEGMVLDAALSGEGLIEAMRAVPAPEYVVREADGSGFRVLSTKDVATAVAP